MQKQFETDGDWKFSVKNNNEREANIIKKIIKNFCVSYEIRFVAFSNCASLTQISIPSSVTSIGGYAFAGCSSLTQISIPSSVTRIGSWAFENCRSLTQIEIPSSVTRIGSCAFRGCRSLTQITIPSSMTSIDLFAFCNLSSLTQITIPNSVTSIGSFAFHSCYCLKQISIPSSVTSIGNWAFENCRSLKQITIPKFLFFQTENWGLNKNVKIVEDDGWKFSVKNNEEQDANIIEKTIKNFREPEIPCKAFKDCASLTQISIPSSVTSIGGYAFAGCSSLTQISIFSSVTYIGAWAFTGCSSLTQISIPSNVTSIGYYAFQGCSSLKQISIPSSVTSIGGYAFSDCSSLKQIEIPATATTGADVFAGHNSLRYITILIPNNVTDNNYYITCFSLFSKIPHSSNIKLKVNNSQISFNDNKDNPQKILLDLPTENQNVKDFIAWIFQNCTDLTKFTIPSSVTSIEHVAFDSCSSLKQITIPSSVTSIGRWAFANCSSLKEIKIPSSVTSIGECAFRYCSSLEEITIPSSVTSIGEYAFENCSNLEQITIPEHLFSQKRNLGLNENVKIVEYDGWEILVKNNYEEEKNRIKVIIEKCCMYDEIFYKAFKDCNSLTQITIPSSVTRIENNAFQDCSNLRQITIPSSVTYIGGNAFSGCSSLKQIEIPNDKQLISIVSRAIENSNITPKPKLIFTTNQSKEDNNPNIPLLEEKDIERH